MMATIDEVRAALVRKKSQPAQQAAFDAEQPTLGDKARAGLEGVRRGIGGLIGGVENVAGAAASVGTGMQKAADGGGYLSFLGDQAKAHLPVMAGVAAGPLGLGLLPSLAMGGQELAEPEAFQQGHAEEFDRSAGIASAWPAGALAGEVAAQMIPMGAGAARAGVRPALDTALNIREASPSPSPINGGANGAVENSASQRAPGRVAGLVGDLAGQVVEGAKNPVARGAANIASAAVGFPGAPEAALLAARGVQKLGIGKRAEAPAAAAPPEFGIPRADVVAPDGPSGLSIVDRPSPTASPVPQPNATGAAPAMPVPEATAAPVPTSSQPGLAGPTQALPAMPPPPPPAPMTQMPEPKGKPISLAQRDAVPSITAAPSNMQGKTAPETPAFDRAVRNEWIESPAEGFDAQHPDFPGIGEDLASFLAVSSPDLVKARARPPRAAPISDPIVPPTKTPVEGARAMRLRDSAGGSPVVAARSPDDVFSPSPGVPDLSPGGVVGANGRPPVPDGFAPEPRPPDTIDMPPQDSALRLRESPAPSPLGKTDVMPNPQLGALRIKASRDGGSPWDDSLAADGGAMFDEMGNEIGNPAVRAAWREASARHAAPVEGGPEGSTVSMLDEDVQALLGRGRPTKGGLQGSSAYFPKRNADLGQQAADPDLSTGVRESAQGLLDSSRTAGLSADEVAIVEQVRMARGPAEADALAAQLRGSPRPEPLSIRDAQPEPAPDLEPARDAFTLTAAPVEQHLFSRGAYEAKAKAPDVDPLVNDPRQQGMFDAKPAAPEPPDPPFLTETTPGRKSDGKSETWDRREMGEDITPSYVTKRERARAREDALPKDRGAALREILAENGLDVADVGGKQIGTLDNFSSVKDGKKAASLLEAWTKSTRGKKSWREIGSALDALAEALGVEKLQLPARVREMHLRHDVEDQGG